MIGESGKRKKGWNTKLFIKKVDYRALMPWNVSRNGWRSVSLEPREAILVILLHRENDPTQHQELVGKMAVRQC